MCREKWPDLVCRPVAAQFMAADLISMFELEGHPDQLAAVVSEKHYRLVRPDDLTTADLEAYRCRTQ